MNDTPQVLLQNHLKKLKLPTFHSEYAKLARQCAAEGRERLSMMTMSPGRSVGARTWAT